LHSGAVGGKTGKTAVLPRFCKIGRGSGGAPPYYGGLSWPVRARRAGGAAVAYEDLRRNPFELHCDLSGILR
jgi:hypothetical protein